ncbi:YhgE/Pip family protein [Brachybacterium huguangmaarense]
MHAISGFLRSLAALLPGEWKQRIALLFASGLALVPLIYTGNMVWSFDDPSGHLDRVTAAVVDEDTGATMTRPDGSTSELHVGQDFTENLTELDKPTVYRFVETDRATAEAGLRDGTYGALIEIPSTFSADVASLGGDDPMQAAPALLTVRTNDTVNYFNGNFAKPVANALHESLDSNVLTEYLDNVYVGFTDIHDGLGDAADGASDLADGTGQLVDGTASAVDGTAQLSDGASRLETGSYDLVVGLSQLSVGAGTLADGARTLDDGAGTLATGLTTLDANSGTLIQGSHTLAGATAQVADGSAGLAAGADQLAQGTGELDARVTAAQQRAEELGITPASVDAASRDLQTSIDALAGIAPRVDGLLQGPDGQSSTLADSAQSLSDAVGTVADDSQKLADSVASGAGDAVTVRDGASSVADDATAVDDAVQDAAGSASLAEDDASALDGAVGDYTGTVDSLAADCAASGASADFCDRLTSVASGSDALRADADTVKNETAAVAKALEEDIAPTSARAADTATGMSDAADRVVVLLQGADGNGGLAAATQDVATAADSLRDPAATLAQDATTLSTAIGDARTAILGEGADPATVQQRLDALAGQARTAAASLPDALDRADQAVQGIHRLDAGARQLDAGATRLAGATGQVADGAATLDAGVTRYTDGVHQAAGGATRLADGADQLAAGADRLAGAAAQASDGASQLHDGATQLSDGATQLHDGAVQLNDGATQLDDGATQLSDGLADARDDVPTYTDAEREHLAETAAEPVGLDVRRDNGLGNFGEGLTPLFLGIGLWVGAMAIFLMMPPLSRRAAEDGAGAGALLAGGLLPAIALGAVQTAIILVILRWGIGVTSVHPWQFAGAALLTSVVFVAINHGFGSLFGPVGKFFGLILIALQVSGAGGTYPVETIASFFQWIHPFLPMTYAIGAFRGAIGGAWVAPAHDIAGLLVWLALALVMGLLGAMRMRREVATVGGAGGGADELGEPEADGADADEPADDAADDAADDDASPEAGEHDVTDAPGEAPAKPSARPTVRPATA